MPSLDMLLEEIVTANRILAHEGVVDSFGHVSARHPDNPKRFLLSRARAPERIEKDDIMEFTLEGDPVDARGRAPYLERFIHGGLYEARPDVHSVVHNHSPSVPRSRRRMPATPCSSRSTLRSTPSCRCRQWRSATSSSLLRVRSTR